MINYEGFQGGLRKGLQARWKAKCMNDLRNGGLK